MKIEKGISLLEILIVIAIVGIAVGLAAPSFKGFWQRTSTAGQLNMLRDTMILARSEAITRGAVVRVCASTSGTGCRCASGSTAGTCINWENGWISFVDLNGDGVVDAAEPLLDQVGQLQGDNLTLRTTLTDVAFANRGNILPPVSMSFVTCDAAGTKNAKAVNVFITGSVSTATDTDANDIVNDVTGADVACPP